MPEQAFDDLLERYRWDFGVHEPTVLDWTGVMRVRSRITDAPCRDEHPDAPPRNTVVFAAIGEQLPQADDSVDLVVIGPRISNAAAAEARRVARGGVVTWDEHAGLAVDWLRPAGRATPEVTIIVPVPGRGPERGPAAQACLAAIEAGTTGSPAVEVVVAASVNEGAALARGQFLVIVEPQARVLPGWLRPLVAPLRADDQAGLVTGTLVNGEGRDDLAGQVPAAGFGPMAARRGLFMAVGGVDERIDPPDRAADLRLRIAAAGRTIIEAPQSQAAVRPESPATGTPAELAPRGEAFRRRWGRVVGDPSAAQPTPALALSPGTGAAPEADAAPEAEATAEQWRQRALAAEVQIAAMRATRAWRMMMRWWSLKRRAQKLGR